MTRETMLKRAYDRTNGVNALRSTDKAIRHMIVFNGMRRYLQNHYAGISDLEIHEFLADNN